MNTAHTPGPWTTQKQSSSSPNVATRVVVRVGAWGVHAGPGNVIAEVFHGGPGATETSIKALEANARLISKSPELLEALIDLDPQCVTTPPCGGCKGCFARSVIAEAKGEL